MRDWTRAAVLIFSVCVGAFVGTVVSALLVGHSFEEAFERWFLQVSTVVATVFAYELLLLKAPEEQPAKPSVPLGCKPDDYGVEGQ